ncbi:hypothetical protein [Microbacterium trichothecenolyticum]|nr:hypothetical protein [Microbacterium trichothecenolyticum]
MAPMIIGERPAVSRTLVANQLMLSAATLIGAIASMLSGHIVSAPLFVTGAGVIFVLGIVAVLVPWASLPAWAAPIVPVADVVAIALLRESAPTDGFGLLWAFPAMWIGAVLALRGVGSAVRIGDRG